MNATVAKPGAETLPALPEIDRQRALEALGIADLLSIKIDLLEPEDAARVAYAATQQLERAKALFAAVCTPVNDLITAARQKVRDAIPEGSAMLAHPSLDIRLVDPPTDYVKDVAVLMELEGVLKPDEFKAAMVFSGVDMKDNPKAVEAALAAGAKPIYSPHAGHLNRLADDKHYGSGPDSVVGEIIARGLKKVAKGERRLEITVNKSAVKELRA